jgi:large subunit ribosomal protein L34
MTAARGAAAAVPAASRAVHALAPAAAAASAGQFWALTAAPRTAGGDGDLSAGSTPALWCDAGSAPAAPLRERAVIGDDIAWALEAPAIGDVDGAADSIGDAGACSVRPVGHGRLHLLSSGRARPVLTVTNATTPVPLPSRRSLADAPPAEVPGGAPGAPALDCATKRTYQPSVIRKKRRHGFLHRMSTTAGRRVLSHRRVKRRRFLSI